MRISDTETIKNSVTDSLYEELVFDKDNDLRRRDNVLTAYMYDNERMRYKAYSVAYNSVFHSSILSSIILMQNGELIGNIEGCVRNYFKVEHSINLDACNLCNIKIIPYREFLSEIVKMDDFFHYIQ